MKIIKPSYTILTPLDGLLILRFLEQCARTCYKSEDKASEKSYEPLLRHIISRGHESVLEHVSFSVRFVVDRGVSHEAVRHRLASFSQESTRYCCYGNDRFGGEITVIEPPFFNLEQHEIWRASMEAAERSYLDLLKSGAKPEEARSVLPNSLKTELVLTANIREWRHILRLRTSERAHPQMRELMVPLLRELQERVPILFEDVDEKD